MGIIGRITSLFHGYNWLIIPAAFFAIVLHEISHGYIALLLGDRTAKDGGRLSLNPVHHLDPIGLVCMIIFGFGWAKPVPVNPNNFKNRKLGMSIVALAGPVSNVILAFAALLTMALLLKTKAVSGTVVFYIREIVLNFLYIFAMLDIGLAVFNFIPVPPLDGSKILFSVLPNRAYGFVLKYERYGMLILFVLINIPLFLDFLTLLQRGLFSAILKVIFKIV